ncbi:hypothetical protein ISN76_10000 [Dyella halodurans]|uniref:Uncharacterized protein n=1 Tax=Dyella halodurans TaxID=1920171 RepID=A0ABV9C2T3_9GAMM|nr:hypothetical protein [Dyella halodurans]
MATNDCYSPLLSALDGMVDSALLKKDGRYQYLDELNSLLNRTRRVVCRDIFRLSSIEIEDILWLYGLSLHSSICAIDFPESQSRKHVLAIPDQAREAIRKIGTTHGKALRSRWLGNFWTSKC